MTPIEMLSDARRLNPRIRYALRKQTAENGGAVLGAFCNKAGGFIPVAVETGPNTGRWESMPAGYLEIDGKAVGIEPENWKENRVVASRNAQLAPACSPPRVRQNQSLIQRGHLGSMFAMPGIGYQRGALP